MKTIRIKKHAAKPVFEGNDLAGKDGLKADMSVLNPRSLADRLEDLKAELYAKFDKNKWYADHAKRAAAQARSIKNISMIKVLERMNLQTGMMETCYPYRMRSLCERYMDDMKKHPQLGTFAKFFPKNIIWVDTPEISTAATDGFRVFWNVWFAHEIAGKDMQLFAAEKAANPRVRQQDYQGLGFMFITMHEIYHQLYQHFYRSELKEETRGGRNAMLANIAQDVEINRDIVNQFPQFAKIADLCNALTDSRFINEPWEIMFDAYFKGNVQPPQMGKQQGRQQSNQQGQGGQSQQGQQGGQSQQGQQGGQSQQGQQGGQQGGQQSSGQQGGGMSNGLDSDTSQMTDTQIKAVNDALNDMRSGKNSNLDHLDPNQPLDPGTGAGIPDFDEGEYRDTYNQTVDAVQDAINNIKNGKDIQGNDMNPDAAGNENGDGQDGNGQNGQQGNKPVRSKYDNDNDDQSFNKPDRLTPSELARIAEEAGQPLDAEDMSENPTKRADDFTKANRSAMEAAAGSGKGLTNNSLKNIFDQIQALMAPKIKWQSILKAWMSATVKKTSERKYSRKLLGSRNPEHSLARYLKPKIVTPKGKGGITQVLHIIDTSGSMWGAGANEKFGRILKEAVSCGSTCKVETSRAVTFSSNHITREGFVEWDDNTQPAKAVNMIKNGIKGDSGGTMLCMALQDILKLGAPYYQLKHPTTLIIVYTDGDIDSKSDHDALPNEMKRNMVYVVVTNSRGIESTREQLKSYGYTDRQIIGIDTDKL